MADIRTLEIEAYLDGELPAERMREVEAAARADPEVAAKIAVIGRLTDAPPFVEDLGSRHGREPETMTTTARPTSVAAPSPGWRSGFLGRDHRRVAASFILLVGLGITV